MTADLAQIGALRAIARASVMQFKGTKQPLAQIAERLNVEAVVSGSVIRSEPHVRITAALIQAATGQQLWATRLAPPSFDPAWIATMRYAVFCDLIFQSIKVFA